jgi:hypothetical protein
LTTFTLFRLGVKKNFNYVYQYFLSPVYEKLANISENSFSMKFLWGDWPQPTDFQMNSYPTVSDWWVFLKPYDQFYLKTTFQKITQIKLFQVLNINEAIHVFSIVSITVYKSNKNLFVNWKPTFYIRNEQTWLFRYKWTTANCS